ncbi:MAG: hypothetical protein J6Z79_03435 [Clostridia bacterium]|nr:hypothetical protein [Clostridia bacterium]
MKKTILIVMTVILLLLAVTSSAVFSLGLAENEFLSWDAFRSMALSDGWTEGVRQHIREGFEPLNDVTDIPKELTDAFLEEEVTDDLCTVFWSEGRIDFPGEKLKKALVARIRALAEKLRENGEIQVTEEEWKVLVKSLPETASNYIAVVRKSIMISSWSGSLKTVTDVWSKYYPLFLAVSGAVSLGSLGLLALIYKRRFLTVAYAGLTGTGLTLLIPAVWLKVSGFAGRLRLDPDYLKAFFVCFYERFSQRMFTTALIVTIAGLICGVAAILLSRRGKGKNGREEGTEV